MGKRLGTCRSRRGIAGLEFVMVLPIMVALLILIFYVGHAGSDQLELSRDAYFETSRQRHDNEPDDITPLCFVEIEKGKADIPEGTKSEGKVSGTIYEKWGHETKAVARIYGNSWSAKTPWKDEAKWNGSASDLVWPGGATPLLKKGKNGDYSMQSPTEEEFYESRNQFIYYKQRNDQTYMTNLPFYCSKDPVAVTPIRNSDYVDDKTCGNGGTGGGGRETKPGAQAPPAKPGDGGNNSNNNNSNNNNSNNNNSNNNNSNNNNSNNNNSNNNNSNNNNSNNNNSNNNNSNNNNSNNNNSNNNNSNNNNSNNSNSNNNNSNNNNSNNNNSNGTNSNGTNSNNNNAEPRPEPVPTPTPEPSPTPGDGANDREPEDGGDLNPTPSPMPTPSPTPNPIPTPETNDPGNNSGGGISGPSAEPSPEPVPTPDLEPKRDESANQAAKTLLIFSYKKTALGFTYSERKYAVDRDERKVYEVDSNGQFKLAYDLNKPGDLYCFFGTFSLDGWDQAVHTDIRQFLNNDDDFKSISEEQLRDWHDNVKAGEIVTVNGVKFRRLTDGQSSLHGENCAKFVEVVDGVNKIGSREFVINKYYKLETSERYRGTYNYITPGANFKEASWWGHAYYDWKSYVWRGNSEGDTTPPSERLIPKDVRMKIVIWSVSKYIEHIL